MGITVRPMKSGEEKQVSEMIFESLDSSVSKFYNPDIISAIKHSYSSDKVASMEVYVAYDKDKLSGCIAIDDEKKEAKMLYVNPDSVRSGIGTILMDYALGVARYRGYEVLKAEALDSSLEFVKKFGCEVIGSRAIDVGDTSFNITDVKFPL